MGHAVIADRNMEARRAAVLLLALAAIQILAVEATPAVAEEATPVESLWEGTTFEENLPRHSDQAVPEDTLSQETVLAALGHVRPINEQINAAHVAEQGALHNLENARVKKPMDLSKMSEFQAETLAKMDEETPSFDFKKATRDLDHEEKVTDWTLPLSVYRANFKPVPVSENRPPRASLQRLP